MPGATHSVIWTEPAVADLRGIYLWTADRANRDVALRLLQRIEEAAEKLTDYPRRGRPRDEIRPGLRSIPFERAAIIFYEAGENRVQIVRVIDGRRDLAAAIEEKA